MTGCKCCPACERTLSSEQFNLSTAFTDGRWNICRDCRNAKRRQERLDPRVRALEAATAKRARAKRRPRGPFVCPQCGASRPVLHKHRIVPGFMGGEYVDGNVARLCANCHEDAHRDEDGVVIWAGRQADPEVTAKRSESMRRIRAEKDWTAANAKISEALMGNQNGLGNRGNPNGNSGATKGNKWTDEQRARQRSAQQARRVRERVGAAVV